MKARRRLQFLDGGDLETLQSDIEDLYDEFVMGQDDLALHTEFWDPVCEHAKSPELAAEFLGREMDPDVYYNNLRTMINSGSVHTLNDKSTAESQLDFLESCLESGCM